MQEQLSFFEISRITKKLDKRLLQEVKIETILPECPPNQYILHPTGGYHYFCGTAEKGSKYNKDIWPYITSTIVTKTGMKRTQIVSISVSTLNGYPTVSLLDHNHPSTCPKLMHVIVGRAYCPNDDPEKKKYVAHLHDENCDYLPEDLEWQTGSDNHMGKPHRRRSEKDDYYLYCKENGWVK